MKRTGQVVSAGDGQAIVAIDGIGQCQRCANGGGCGLGVLNGQLNKELLNKQQSGKDLELSCKTSLPVSPRQQVIVKIDDIGHDWLWAVMGAYGLPTLGFLLAAVVGAWVVAPGISSLLSPEGLVASITLDASGVGFKDFVALVCAIVGLIGGVIAWRCMAPDILARSQQGLCLQSARIVAVGSLSSGDSE